MLEIQNLIIQESEKEDFDIKVIWILEDLKRLNKKAYLFMRGYGKTWKQKYREMWKQPFWKEAKRLLRKYFHLKEGKIICKICKTPIRGSFTLHHKDFYNDLNYFTPLYVELVHHKCHQWHHYTEKND